MACGDFLNGAPGTNARFQVTQDNGETFWGKLTDFDRTTNHLIPVPLFSGQRLRNGIDFPLVAGHSYHFTIAKSPVAGQIRVQATIPPNPASTCSSDGRFVGPWVIRV